MSTEFNPYAPPKAQVEHAPIEAIWRDGATLLLRPGTALPPRCVKCNLPAVQPIKARWVSWHSPWLYVFLLLNIIIYAIVASAVQKREKIAPGLCSAHVQRRRKVIAGAWLGVFASLAIIVLAMKFDQLVLGVVGVITLLLAIVLGIVGSRIVYAIRIDKDLVQLKGCEEAFLQSIR